MRWMGLGNGEVAIVVEIGACSSDRVFVVVVRE